MEMYAIGVPTAHQLELIAAVAEHSSITAASRALAITQPAASAQLKLAEQRIGAKLFDRTAEGLRPTAVGKLLVDFAHAEAARTRELASQVAELVQGRRGVLLVGASTTPAAYFIPPWLRQFRSRHPQADVSVWIGNSRQTLERLRRGAIDLAIVGEQPRTAEIRSFVVARDNIVLVAAPSLPIVRKSVAPEALTDATFIVREEGSATRAKGLQCLARLGLQPRRLMQLSSNEAVARMVEAEMGIGILSARAVDEPIREGRIAMLSVRGWNCYRSICVAIRKESSNVLVEKFLELVRRTGLSDQRARSPAARAARPSGPKSRGLPKMA